jgi:shikimate kinase
LRWSECVGAAVAVNLEAVGPSRRLGIVLATGGGVIVRDENRRHLAERGTVIFLDSPLESLVERTRRDRRRPLLRDASDPLATFERLADERRHLYESIADYRFFASRGSPQALAREIARQLRKDGYFRKDAHVTDD